MIKHLQKICVALVIALLCGMTAVMPHNAFGTDQDLSTRLGGNATGIYYPLYNLDELPQVIAAKKEFPSIPFNVNINPASGPGTGPSATWNHAISELRDAGAVVTGYVPTGYGTGKNVTEVENMILAYNKFYPNLLDGMMFDEVSGSCSEFGFYKTVSDYARSLGYSYIRANVGGPVCKAEIPLFNQVAIYEGSGYPDESLLESRSFYPQYAKGAVGFGATIHSEPKYDPSWIFMATKYLKWIYITDQAEPNPYAKFPSYFYQYLADLSSTNRQVTPEFGTLASQAFTISVVVILISSMLFSNLAFGRKS